LGGDNSQTKGAAPNQGNLEHHESLRMSRRPSSYSEVYEMKNHFAWNEIPKNLIKVSIRKLADM
jgi:hypothetical protein